MKRAKMNAPAEADKRIAPDDMVLEQIANLPEKAKLMALAYGHGLIAGGQIINGSGKTA